MQFDIRKSIKLNPVQILALGFCTVIILGALILSLPISSAEGETTNFLDAVFTSTSAVCVTGLITLDTSTHWSTFGHTVIMLLIEIGGLGFMSFATLVAIAIGKKITLRERLIMQEAMNAYSIQGLVKMVKYIFGFTFAVQFFGALLLSTQFIPKFGLGRGIFYSVFHSVSAFCNAGFDLFGNSLVGFSSNVVVILVISSLIIIGGIGFAVWIEIYEYKKGKKFSLHSKIVIAVTCLLLFGGAMLFFVFEYTNAKTIGSMGLSDKILNSFFASVTPRTAGFNSVSVGDMTIAGKLLTIILMFIGGSSGSTAGGLKITTITIIVLAVISVIRSREDVEVFGRRLGKEIVYKAFTLLFIGSGLIIIATMILSYTEVGVSFIDLLFETTSALGTVGMTTGVTPNLSPIGKILIIILMYFGRVGALTVVLAMTRSKKKTGYRYPEGKILIG